MSKIKFLICPNFHIDQQSLYCIFTVLICPEILNASANSNASGFLHPPMNLSFQLFFTFRRVSTSCFTFISAAYSHKTICFPVSEPTNFSFNWLNFISAYSQLISIKLNFLSPRCFLQDTFSKILSPDSPIYLAI